MRATGKTTRLIDKAVQMLFTEGEIHLISEQVLKLHPIDMREKLRGLPKDVFKSLNELQDLPAQNYFIERLLRRLRFEHESWIEIKKMSYGYIITFERLRLQEALKKI